MPRLNPAAVVLTLIFESGGSLIMIIWGLYKEHMEERIEKIKAESRAEGVSKTYGLWEAWNNRRLEAERDNLPFNEPPPPPPQMPASE